jgi:hypothetical protein
VLNVIPLKSHKVATGYTILKKEKISPSEILFFLITNVQGFLIGVNNTDNYPMRVKFNMRTLNCERAESK